MLFNSLEFAVFFAVVMLAYKLLRTRLHAQNLLLLGSSYLFYGWWDIRFLFLIVLSTGIDYCAGLMIERGKLTAVQRMEASLFLVITAVAFVLPQYTLDASSPLGINWSFDHPLGWQTLIGTLGLVVMGNILYPHFVKLSTEKQRKIALTISICTNLGILGFFKYFNFFSEGFAELWSTVFGTEVGGLTLNIILPVGISFYTFQTMSYTLDVYSGKVKSSNRIVEFATYVAFFPQLVAGPIERASHLLPQFRTLRPALTPEAFKLGVWLIIWGLYKKIVVADNMAIIVNQCFRPFDDGSTVIPEDGLTLLLGVYAFAFQIYGDFSGYTDIARGVAKLMGFEIMLNFNLPYFATNPSSFWRRWHISLSTWLRDYLYIALGGNRKGAFRVYVNLSLTMLLGGLWHGASWTFVVWGAFHGVILVIYRLAKIEGDWKTFSWRLVPAAIVMFHLTCVGWLIFRSQNLDTVWIFLEAIITSPKSSATTWEYLFHILKFQWFVMLYQLWQVQSGSLQPHFKAGWFARLNVWLVIMMSLFTLAARGKQEFLYFDF